MQLSGIAPKITNESVPNSPKENKENESWSFAICPICKVVQSDILVSKKIKKQKLIFCSANCSEIFKNKVLKKVEE